MPETVRIEDFARQYSWRRNCEQGLRNAAFAMERLKGRQIAAHTHRETAGALAGIAGYVNGMALLAGYGSVHPSAIPVMLTGLGIALAAWLASCAACKAIAKEIVEVNRKSFYVLGGLYVGDGMVRLLDDYVSPLEIVADPSVSR